MVIDLETTVIYDLPADALTERTEDMPLYDPDAPARRPDADVPDDDADADRAFSYVAASTGELPLIVRTNPEPEYVGRHRAPDEGPAVPAAAPALWPGLLSRLTRRGAR